MTAGERTKSGGMGVPTSWHMALTLHFVSDSVPRATRPTAFTKSDNFCLYPLAVSFLLARMYRL